MLSRDCLQKQSLFDDTAALSGEVIYRHHFKAGAGGGLGSGDLTKPNSTEMHDAVLLRRKRNKTVNFSCTSYVEKV